MASVNAGGGNMAGARPSTALAAGSRQQQQQQSRRPPLQNGIIGSRTQPSPQHRIGQSQLQHQRQHQSHNRPRFSPYTPPLSSAIPISSGRATARVRHATVSTDADIDDPRIYPTEISSSRGQQETQASAMSRSYDCTFFSGGANAKGHGRRGEFVIHPEWLSESVSIERLRINERPLIMPTGTGQHQNQKQSYQSQLSHPSHYPNRNNQTPQQQQQQHQHQHQHQLQQQLSLPADLPRRCRSAPPPPQSQHHQGQNPITWQ